MSDTDSTIAEIFEFTWKIEYLDFHLATGQTDLLSPIFTLQALRSSRWFLRVHHYGMNQLYAYLSLSLHRARDNVPDSLTLNYKMSIIDSNDINLPKGHVSQLHTKDFPWVNDSDDFETDSSVLTCRRRLTYTKNELHIECFIYSDLAHGDNSVDETLCQDITALLETPYFSDLTLCAGDVEVNVHKAILSIRSPALAEKLALNKPGRMRLVEDMDGASLKVIARYLYSGKIDGDKINLPSRLYAIAESYKMDNLVSHLYPVYKNHVALSTFKMKSQNFKWTIEELDKLQPNMKLYSPRFCVECGSKSYIGLILSIAIGETGYVEIFVHSIFTNVVKLVMVYCRITDLNVRGELDSNRSAFRIFYKEGEWRFPNFVRYSTYNPVRCRYMPRKTLTLQFQLKIFDRNITSEISESRSIAKLFSKGVEDLSVVSFHLGNLYKSKEFVDAFISSRSTIFKVHKAILCARSPALRKFLQHRQEDTQTLIEMRTADDSVVAKMVWFLYTGKVKDLYYEECMKLYLLAHILGIGSLKKKCSTFLEGCVTRHNAGKLLAMANDLRDDSLKNFLHYYITSKIIQTSFTTLCHVI